MWMHLNGIVMMKQTGCGLITEMELFAIKKIQNIIINTTITLYNNWLLTMLNGEIGFWEMSKYNWLVLSPRIANNKDVST